MSKFDQLYRSILLSKYFIKGWGSPENLKRLMDFHPIVLDREKCHSLVPKNYHVTIDKEEKLPDCILLEGHFKSPFAEFLPEIVPVESKDAYFQVLLPTKWRTRLKPMCLHLAGTGDHFYWRRRTLLAKPLLKEANIGSIILENPFYGLRKPKQQMRSNLHNVSDIFVMGGCLALESTVLFHWCERQGLGPLGVTGISMGGHMASIAASVWPQPIALIPCLSWTTASCVFTQGVMSGAIPWHLLENQYFSNCVYREQILNMISHMNNDTVRTTAKDVVEETSRLKVTQLQRPMPNSEVVSERNIRPKPIKSFMNDDSTSKILETGISMDMISRTNSGLKLLAEMKSDDRGPVIPRTPKKESCTAAVQFMKGIMDEFTHLGYYSKPVDPTLIIIVAAKDDAYVLREGVTDLTEIWPGAEVRYINAGHIAAFLFKQSVFRQAIVDAFDRLIAKYYEVQ